MLRVFVYSEKPAPVIDLCLRQACEVQGVILVEDPRIADVACAPLLQRRLSPAELEAPRLGVLVFHPSLLPVHRGRDAIRCAFSLGEVILGATWFWANASYDAGDICEQEVLLAGAGESPRAFYDRAVVPAAARLLGYALGDLVVGHVRRRPQVEENATYDPRVIRASASTTPKAGEGLSRAVSGAIAGAPGGGAGLTAEGPTTGDRCESGGNR